jgi:hypothetical protein
MVWILEKCILCNIECGIKLQVLTLSINSVASVRKRIPTERPPLVSEVSANFFADRWWHVVSVTNPYDRILGFLDRSRYCFFQVALQLYSRGWVDPVPDPVHFFLVVPGNRTQNLWICSPELWPLDHRGCQRSARTSLETHYFSGTHNHSVNSSVVLTRLSGPRFWPTTSHKIW